MHRFLVGLLPVESWHRRPVVCTTGRLDAPCPVCAQERSDRRKRRLCGWRGGGYVDRKEISEGVGKMLRRGFIGGRVD